MKQFQTSALQLQKRETHDQGKTDFNIYVEDALASSNSPACTEIFIDLSMI